jgi:hypothetical protein
MDDGCGSRVTFPVEDAYWQSLPVHNLRLRAAIFVPVLTLRLLESVEHRKTPTLRSIST